MVNEEKVHSSWRKLFEDQRESLSEIERNIVGSYTPSKEYIFRFAENDLMHIKCCVFGKDPYPQYNEKNGGSVATGRAFEVNYVESWLNPAVNRSLQNIVKLLHKTYFGLEHALSIEEVREEIASGKFPILPPNKVFNHWEREGVLFLNSAFTTELGQIGKHLKVWEPFFNRVLDYMTSYNTEIIYFLWGDARKYKERLLALGVKEESIYTSYHPSSFYGDKGGFGRDGKFLQSPCFKDTSNKIRWI